MFLNRRKTQKEADTQLAHGRDAPHAQALDAARRRRALQSVWQGSFFATLSRADLLFRRRFLWRQSGHSRFRILGRQGRTSLELGVRKPQKM